MHALPARLALPRRAILEKIAVLAQMGRTMILFNMDGRGLTEPWGALKWVQRHGSGGNQRLSEE
jgi:hypothetical protein